MGDELARHTGRADLAARVGGDEFAVLLVDVAATLGSDAISRLQQGLLAAVSSRRGRPVTFTSPPDSSQEDLRVANEAMYCVKRGSKNAVRQT